MKDPPAMQQTRVGSLGREDPLEKEMATHSNILTWEIPWTEEPGGLQSMGLQRVRHDLATKQQHFDRFELIPKRKLSMTGHGFRYTGIIFVETHSTVWGGWVICRQLFN